jgi:hypothetical protein
MKKLLTEKPCINLMNEPHRMAEGSDPAGKEQRARAECLCDEDKDCPKKRNKRDLTMHCFRIRRPPRKKKGEK